MSESATPLSEVFVNETRDVADGFADAVRESEERFRAFASASFDVVYRMSPDWTEMRHLQGRHFIADTLEPSRSWLEKYIHPDDQPLVLEAIKRAVQTKSTFELEHRVVRVDDTLGWTHSRAIPILDARGEIVEWFGAARDVTPRKEAVAALEQRAAQQAAIAALSKTALAETCIENLMDEVVHCVAQTLRTELAKVLEVAPGGGELLLRAGVGWKPGLVGRAVVGAGRDSQAGFTLLEDGPVVVTDLRTETRFTGPPLLLDHDVVSGMSCVIRGSDGRHYGVLGTHTRCRREFSADEVNFLRSVANVLAAAIMRRRSEEALREAESRVAAEAAAVRRERDRIQQYLNVTGSLMVALDRDGRVVLANRKTCEALGYSEVDVVGKDWFEHFLPGQDRRQLRDAFDRMVRGESSLEHHENAVLTADGRERMIHWHNAEIRDPDGQLASVLSSGLDVTERRRAEGALRESEVRQAFLVRVDDSLRPLADAGAIQDAAAFVLGEYLRVTRATYADVEDEPGAEMVTIRNCYRSDDGNAVAAFPGRYACNALFGEQVMALRRRGEIMVVADVTTDPAFGASERAVWAANGVRASIAASLVKDGRMVAGFGVQSAAPRSWTAQEIGLVEATAERTWAAVERARAEAALRASEERSRTLAANLEQRNAQLQKLSTQLAAIEQHERRRLAITLHDGLQQLIVAAKLRLPQCLEEDGSEQIQRIDRLLDEAIEAVRTLAWELSPPALAISTLPEALEWLADWFDRQHGFHIRNLAPEAIPPLPEHTKSLLFSAARELLLNCVKHSGVKAATLELRADAMHELQIGVADDGAGFDPAKAVYGFGLSSIRERLAALRGRLVIESAPGAGTRCTMSLPLPEAQ